MPAWHKGPLCSLPQRARGRGRLDSRGAGPSPAERERLHGGSGCLGPRAQGLQSTGHLPWDQFHVLCGPGCCSTCQMGAGLTVPRSQPSSWPPCGTCREDGKLVNAAGKSSAQLHSLGGWMAAHPPTFLTPLRQPAVPRGTVRRCAEEETETRRGNPTRSYFLAPHFAQ